MIVFAMTKVMVCHFISLWRKALSNLSMYSTILWPNDLSIGHDIWHLADCGTKGLDELIFKLPYQTIIYQIDLPAFGTKELIMAC